MHFMNFHYDRLGQATFYKDVFSENNTLPPSPEGGHLKSISEK